METAIATQIESIAVPVAAAVGVEDGDDPHPTDETPPPQHVIEVFTLSLRGATGTSADLSRSARVLDSLSCLSYDAPFSSSGFSFFSNSPLSSCTTYRLACILTPLATQSISPLSGPQF